MIRKWFQKRFRFLVSLVFLGMAALMTTRGIAAEMKAQPFKPSETSVLAPVSFEEVASGFDIPWSLEFLPSGEILVTERSGKLFRLNLNTKKRDEITGVPKAKVGGQGGLLDAAVAPDFLKTQRIYLTYSKLVGALRSTAIGYGKLSSNQIIDFKEIFVAEPASNETLHFGSRIAFDRKGYLYFSVGDRGQRNLAQSLQVHNGKILRLHEDGRVPIDNPFVKTPGAKPEIWSYGHRNPQGLFYDQTRSELWSNEHGPRGGDELNLIIPGKNFGWPVISYGREYYGPKIGEGTEKIGMEQPKFNWTPSIGPAALVRYQGSKLIGAKDLFFSAALALTHLNLLRLKQSDSSEDRWFTHQSLRIRDVIEGPDELLYFSTDNGQIFRVKPGT